MDSMLTSYGIDAAAFTSRIQATRAVVAGSFALAGYLQQVGLEAGFEPADMDIFLPGRAVQALNDDGSPVEPAAWRIHALESWAAFLVTQGFTENNKFGKSVAEAGEYSKTIAKLQRVVSFDNEAGKEIQIIVVDTYDIVRHMITEFDLSCCVTWWMGDTAGFHAYASQTREKKMFLMHESRTEAEKTKMEGRIKKYEARGFTFIRPICPKRTRADKREYLADAKFDDLKACDIFTMSDVPIRDWLAASDWNIVLKAGEQFYAFDRKPLMELMAKHQTPIDGRIGVLYDTPLSQSITTAAYWGLRYSDYSIYELKPAYTVTVGTKVKSIYTLTGFSMKAWISGGTGEPWSPPPYQPQVVIPNAEGVRQLLRSLAEMFIGVPTEEVVAKHSNLIPAGNLDLFRVIMQEVNRPMGIN
jgi:hypothetical protein